MKYTIVDLEMQEDRSLLYVQASGFREFEVLYAGRVAPTESKYTWEHVPGVHLHFGPLSFRSHLALKTALSYSRAGVWIAVQPDLRILVMMSRLAARKGIHLTVWLDETQKEVWTGVTLLRALNYKIETRFLSVGMEDFGRNPSNGPSATGEAA